jgi:hypothetical protein
MHTQPVHSPPSTLMSWWGRTVRVVARAGRFLVELAAMCAVMCMGGAALGFVAFGAAGLLGYPDLARQAPALSVVIIAVCLSVPMSGYMAARRHPRRHNALMTGTTLTVGLLAAALVRFGVVPTAGVYTWHDLFGLVCLPACALMVVEMVVGFDMYSGRAHHGQRA